MLSLVSTLIAVQERTRTRLGSRTAWLTKFTEELPQLVWTAQASGAKTFCSRKYLEFTGAKSVSEMDSCWQNYIHPDDRSEVARRWFHSLETGDAYKADYRLRRNDGIYRYFSAAALPVRNRAGLVLSWLGISNDIHDEKLAEQVRQQEIGLSSVQRLAATMAHEINNPLEGLTNALYLAVHGNVADSRTREEYLRLAEQQLHRLSHVASHSLRLHRQVTPPVFADLTSIMEAALTACEHRLRSVGVKIDRKYASQSKIKCLDQDIGQVCEHLIRNALDAMTAGGTLTVRIRAATDWKNQNDTGIRITVADTGTGIPVSVREQLFQPFITTKGELRSGLGLWTTRQIVWSHQGRITFRSSTGGATHWTVFQVFLPYFGLIEGPEYEPTEVND
jgi:PAS domain S-box-containing protein